MLFLMLATVASTAAPMTLLPASPSPARCGAIDARMVRYVPPAEARGRNPLFRLVAPPANGGLATTAPRPFDCAVTRAGSLRR